MKEIKPKITPPNKNLNVSTSFQAVPLNMPTQINQFQAVPMVATSTPTQFVINTQPMMAVNPTTLPLTNISTNQMTTFLQNTVPNNSGPVIVKLLDNNFAGQNFITIPTQTSTPTQKLVIPNTVTPTQTKKVDDQKNDGISAEIKTELEIEEITDEPCEKPDLVPPTPSAPTQSSGNEAMVIKDEIEDEFYIGDSDKAKSRNEGPEKKSGELGIYRCEFCKRKFDCPRGLKVHIGYCKNFDKFKKNSASGEPLTVNLTDRFVPYNPTSTTSSRKTIRSPTRGAYSQKISLDAKLAKLKESEYDLEVRQALSGIKVRIKVRTKTCCGILSDGT